MRIDIIAGARPNFMKIAPIIRALEPGQPKVGPCDTAWCTPASTMTPRLSGDFFAQLGIPEPDVNLGGRLRAPRRSRQRRS